MNIIFSVLLAINPTKDKNYHTTITLIEQFLNKGIHIFVDDDNYEQLKQYDVCKYNNEAVQYVIVLGGDGTLLRSAHKYNVQGRLFVGVNLGTIGYLNGTKQFSITKILDSLINKTYDVKIQQVYEATLHHSTKVESFVFYNEATIHRGCTMKQMHLKVTYSNLQEQLIDADGIIVSTPMGSSAYNLSAGGPILAIGCKKFIVTPICAKAKELKPLIFDDSINCRIDLLSNRSVDDRINMHPVLTMDGLIQADIFEGDYVTIAPLKTDFKMVWFLN